jgi:hypothetical protein
MRNLFILLFIVFSTTAFAQVGIGTAFPDPSSILDIQSTDQGLLVPRMTSLQRLDIDNPAKGLIIFDTDLDLFYFFDSLEWLPLGAQVMRTKYKLVQDIDDLAEELTGGKYILQTDFLYEINGAISIDAPIELNGAYIEGVDTGSDILINNSGGALFTGSTVGSLRNLTISANNQEVFDVTGDGSGLMVVNNCIFAGASALGTLSNLQTVFFSITQYVGNQNGFELSNLSTLLMTSIFWTASNAGTFMSLSGDFNNLQIGNGRIESDSGETGIDVSGNPTINNAASLSQLSFVGAGSPVKGYTAGSYDGYFFTKDWDVNCAGIPEETDAVSVGDINFNYTAGGGATTSFDVLGNRTPKKLSGATTSNNLFRFEATGDNRVIYKGKRKRFFNISASASFEGSAPGDRYIFYIARGKAGATTPTVISETGSWRVVGNLANISATSSIRDISTVPISGVVELEPDDYIEVWIERFSGVGQVFTVALNLTIL